MLTVPVTYGTSKADMVHKKPIIFFLYKFYKAISII